MGNIKKIFFRDVAALLKNPLAAIIAGGLCVLPALYAWFNIYSNWDPYGSTGNIRIAVATSDRGYNDLSGQHVNVSQKVIETLRENESIAWTEAESAEAAVEGVNDGSYYAAVVFAEDFTECMYHGFLDGLRRPAVTYYENEKKNAVATKITDTAVSTLQNNINEQYISLVVSTLFDKQQIVVQDIESEQVIETVTGKIASTNDVIRDFAVIVRALQQANDKLNASLESAGGDLSAIRDNLDKAQDKVEDVPDTDALAASLNRLNSQAAQSVGNALGALRQAGKADVQETKQEYYQRVGTALAAAKGSIDDLADSIQTINMGTLQLSPGILLPQLENQSASLEYMIEQVNSGSLDTEDSNLSEGIARQLEIQLTAMQQILQSTVTQALSALGTQLQTVSGDVSQVLENVKEDIDIVDSILGTGTTTIDLANKSFSGIEKHLNQVGDKLDEILGILDGISDAELTQKFLEFLQGNPEDYGAFFAEPVTIETESIYPVENYGSGVAPFYTTLALWVGGVVLVSLIKVRAHTDGLQGKPKEYELFLGRYLLFFVLGIIQTVIIVWGDIYILHIQCLYPGRFLLASLLASLTFTLLIYSFTLSFGDVGKALIVVIMVIQIAGSSGTYPIEILPEFYRRVYIFFPFPYAINAMREAICGMYEQDFTLYLLRLSLFAVAALVLGLVIRIPFIRINHFVERRMEDTEMM